MRLGRVAALPAAVLVGYVAGRRRRGAARPRGHGRAIEKGPKREALPTPDQFPGVDATEPRRILAAGWRQLALRAWHDTLDDNVPLLAAGVAFYSFLALFPALIAAVTVYGLVADPAEVREQVQSLSRVMPEEVAQLIGDQLDRIASASNQALSVGLAVSLLAALFTASGGVANLIKAINLAYDQREKRKFVKLRAVALLLTLCAIVFVVVAIGLIAVLPVVLNWLGLGRLADASIAIARWAGLTFFMIAALAIVYHYAPARTRPRFSWVSVGAVVGTVLWILGSVGFSVYVTNFGSYSKTYGALAGVAILLLWLFLTAFVVLFGAEINSEMEHQTANGGTVGPPNPLGERGAGMADTVAEDRR